ncbi:MAG: DUF6279 family lipoprotein [Caldimonas sp.]
MITTFNTMLPAASSKYPPRNRLRSSIIAALTLVICALAAGCSLLKIGYGQASPLAFRWLDGYVDFDDAQSLRVRTALDEAMRWHRRTQLPDYVELLVRAEGEVRGDVSPERMCAWGRDLRDRGDVLAQYALPTVVEIALTLSPAQIGNIEKRQVKTNAEWRDDHLQRDPEKRRRAEVKREIERAEEFYGDLDDGQRALVLRSVAASPYDAELSYAERLARQRDAVALVRRWRDSGTGRDEALAQARGWVQRLERSPRQTYRLYSDRLADYRCSFASELHNTTSAGQRSEAVKKLKGYEGDLRALIAEAASG